MAHAPLLVRVSELLTNVHFPFLSGYLQARKQKRARFSRKICIATCPEYVCLEKNCHYRSLARKEGGVSTEYTEFEAFWHPAPTLGDVYTYIRTHTHTYEHTHTVQCINTYITITLGLNR